MVAKQMLYSISLHDDGPQTLAPGHLCWKGKFIGILSDVYPFFLHNKGTIRAYLYVPNLMRRPSTGVHCKHCFLCRQNRLPR